MKNIFKTIFISLFIGNLFVAYAAAQLEDMGEQHQGVMPRKLADCYDPDGRLYHPKINPLDFNQEGHLLSDRTIEKIRNIYQMLGSPSCCEISKENHLELFFAGETPRTALFMNGQLFILYKGRDYLGRRPLREGRKHVYGDPRLLNEDLRLPEFMMNEKGLFFYVITDTIEVAWNVDKNCFVAMRVSYTKHVAGEDSEYILKNRGASAERAALKKLNRLFGEMVVQKTIQTKEFEDDEKSVEMVINIIYSAEPLVPGESLPSCLVFDCNSWTMRDKATISALEELQRIHDQGIVHRDVERLQNFFYDSGRNRTYLIDFESALSDNCTIKNIADENKEVLISLMKHYLLQFRGGDKRKDVSILLEAVENNEHLEDLTYYINELRKLPLLNEKLF